jgi:hypothetical protein
MSQPAYMWYNCYEPFVQEWAGAREIEQYILEMRWLRGGGMKRVLLSFPL